MAEFTELKNKPESEKVNVTEKVQLTKRARYNFVSVICSSFKYKLGLFC